MQPSQENEQRQSRRKALFCSWSWFSTLSRAAGGQEVSPWCRLRSWFSTLSGVVLGTKEQAPCSGEPVDIPRLAGVGFQLSPVQRGSEKLICCCGVDLRFSPSREGNSEDMRRGGPLLLAGLVIATLPGAAEGRSIFPVCLWGWFSTLSRAAGAQRAPLLPVALVFNSRQGREGAR